MLEMTFTLRWTEGNSRKVEFSNLVSVFATACILKYIMI